MSFKFLTQKSLTKQKRTQEKHNLKWNRRWRENKKGIKIEGKHHHQLMSFETFNLSAPKLYMWVLEPFSNDRKVFPCDTTCSHSHISLSLSHPSFEVQKKNTRKFSFKSFMAAAASNLSHFQWLLYVKKRETKLLRGGEKNVAHIDGYRMKKTFLFLLIAVRGIRRYFSIINKTIFIRFRRHRAQWKVDMSELFLFHTHISSMQIHTHTKLRQNLLFWLHNFKKSRGSERSKIGR